MTLLSHYSNVSLICISTLLYDTFVIFWMSLYNCPLVSLSVMYCVIDSRVYLSFLNTIPIILSRPFVLVISMMLDMRCYFDQFPLYIKSLYVIVFVIDAFYLLYMYYYLLLLMITHGELAIFIYIMLHIINMDVIIY